MTVSSAATTLRARIKDPNGTILVCPGVYDGFSARIALETGFDCLYMTGAGTSASLLGQADLGIAGLHDMRSHAEMIANISPATPLIADADTGYGGPINITRTVQSYARSGVAGLHIEDQIQTKRCGHLQGKELVEQDVFLTRIRAAVLAREAVGSDIVIIARTDALQKYGWDEAIKRLKAAKACGADVGFLEGIRSKEEATNATKTLDFPLLLNMVYGGSTPAVSVAEAGELGFRIVIFPFAALSPAYHAMKHSMQFLKDKGELEDAARMTPKEVFEVVGLKDALQIDADAGGFAYQSGV